MIKQEVEKEVPAVNFQPILGADEGEAGAELEQEAADLLKSAPGGGRAPACRRRG